MSPNTLKPRGAIEPGMQLTQVGGTSIYVAPKPETLAFLLFGNGTPPPAVALPDTWAATGTPLAPGYYLFLSAPPASMSPTQLEKQLRAALPTATPTATGCVWAQNSAGAVNVVQALPFTLDANQQPVVAQDVQLNLPDGITPIGFAARSAVFATNNSGAPSALLFSHPPLPNSDKPRPGGVTISLTGPNTRLLTFTGMMSIQPAGAASAVKTLVAATTDLLDPFGPGNQILQQSVILSSDSAGYHLTAE